MSVPKPAITWIGTNGQNLWKGKGLPKLAVVCHIAEGPIGAVDSWFSNPAAQASANYCVGLDGTIHCYVDPEGPDGPFANGLVQGADAQAQAIIAAGGGVNLNWTTVSIEHAGHSGDTLTPAQFQASTRLSAWLCDRFRIAPDEAHILGHYQIDSVTRAHCPGWDRAGWIAYVAAVDALLTPPDPCADLRTEVARLTSVVDAVRTAVAVGVAA